MMSVFQSKAILCCFTLSIAIIAITVGAFTSNSIITTICPKITTVNSDRNIIVTLSSSLENSLSTTRLYNQLKWWDNIIKTFNVNSQEKQSKNDAETSKNKRKTGTVIRCAARSFRSKDSEPSSPNYTTRKHSSPSVAVSPSGVIGDYNHYRTKALSSTPKRAVSILTMDVMRRLSSLGTYNTIQNGDLGENILVDGLDFLFFKVGGVYQIGTVILEITEPIEPCANLCKLEFINRESLKPAERIKRCKDFIEQLGMKDGFRGWYAKVLGSGGDIKIGDDVLALGS